MYSLPPSTTTVGVMWASIDEEESLFCIIGDPIRIYSLPPSVTTID